jgi:hypothetical protein
MGEPTPQPSPTPAQPNPKPVPIPQPAQPVRGKGGLAARVARAATGGSGLSRLAYHPRFDAVFLDKLVKPLCPHIFSQV